MDEDLLAVGVDLVGKDTMYRYPEWFVNCAKVNGNVARVLPATNRRYPSILGKDTVGADA